MSQMLPVGDFKLVENTLQFNNDFLENANEGYSLEGDVECNFMVIYSFYLKK